MLLTKLYGKIDLSSTLKDLAKFLSEEGNIDSESLIFNVILLLEIAIFIIAESLFVIFILILSSNFCKIPNILIKKTPSKFDKL